MGVLHLEVESAPCLMSKKYAVLQPLQVAG